MVKSSKLFERGPLPPTSTSRPPYVIHVISVLSPSPFFAALPLPCTYYTECKAINKKQGGGGGEGLGTRLVKSNVCTYSVDS